MTESAENAPVPRVSWKLRHLLLVPLPGIVHVVTMSVARLLWRMPNAPAGHASSEDYREHYARQFEMMFRAFGIGTIAAVVTCIGVTVLMARALRNGDRAPWEEGAAMFVLLLVVNIGVAFGGCVAVDFLSRRVAE